MTSIEQYEKLKQAINRELKTLGLGEIPTLTIHLEDNGKIVLNFRSEVSKGALLSAEEREILDNFDSIVSSFELEEKSNKQMKGINYDEWDI